MVISTPVLLVTVSMGVYAAVQYHRLNHRSELLAFAFFMFGLSLWLCIDIMVNAVTTSSLKLLGANIINSVALWLVLFSILWFALVYSGHDRWVNRWTCGIAVSVVLVNAGLCIADPEFLYDVEGLATQGPMTVFGFEFERWATLARSPKLPFQLLLPTGYLLALLSGGILCHHFLWERERVYTRLAVAPLVGIAAPIVTNVPVFAGLIPPRLNPIELSFGVTATSFGVAVFRYRLLPVAPAGRRQLVETMSDPVVMVDRDGTVVDSNTAARDLVDAPPDWRGLSAEEFWAPFSEQYKRFEGQTSANTCVSVEQDGQRRHFDLSISPITDDNGVVAGQTVVLRDVTEQHRREQELRETQHELERTVERLERFSGMISHDLRNPLNVAQLRVDLINDTEHTEHLDAAVQSLDRMEGMIDDLYALSQTGVRADEFEPVALGAVATESWDQVATERAALHVDVPESLRVEASRGHLQLVLENLYDNAVTHNSGHLNVWIGLLGRADTDESDTTSGFFVEDDGGGVPEEIRDEMFEYGRTTRDEGTGFGLSIVEEAVSIHGWRIDVTEGEQGGARFEISGVEFRG
jgi:PAS domain S-box-containing protein